MADYSGELAEPFDHDLHVDEHDAALDEAYAHADSVTVPTEAETNVIEDRAVEVEETALEPAGEPNPSSGIRRRRVIAAHDTPQHKPFVVRISDATSTGAEAKSEAEEATQVYEVSLELPTRAHARAVIDRLVEKGTVSESADEIDALTDHLYATLLRQHLTPSRGTEYYSANAHADTDDDAPSPATLQRAAEREETLRSLFDGEQYQRSNLRQHDAVSEAEATDEASNIVEISISVPRPEQSESVTYWSQRLTNLSEVYRRAQQDETTDPRLLQNLLASINMAQTELRNAIQQGDKPQDYGVADYDEDQLTDLFNRMRNGRWNF